MHTLNASDLNLSFDVDIPKVNDSKNSFLAFVYNTSMFKYYLCKRVLRTNRELTKVFDNILNSYHQHELKITETQQFSEMLKRLLHEITELKENLTNSDYFPVNKRKELKSSFSLTIKKIVKLENIVIKERNKDKPKIDDAELMQLVINNNSIELQKQMTKK